MRSRSPIAAVPADAPARHEPRLEAQPAPRLVPRDSAAALARASGRPASSQPQVELYAGERAVVTSDVAASAWGGGGKAMWTKLGVAALGALALVGAVSLLRPFVGL